MAQAAAWNNGDVDADGSGTDSGGISSGGKGGRVSTTQARAVLKQSKASVVGVAVVSPEEAAELHPLLDPAAIVGAVVIPAEYYGVWMRNAYRPARVRGCIRVCGRGRDLTNQSCLRQYRACVR